MATAPQRSCNSELEEGMTDGTFKKVVMNRGGTIDPLTGAVRNQFDDIWHGITECNPKIGPDGLTVNTPNYEKTPPPELV